MPFHGHHIYINYSKLFLFNNNDDDELLETIWEQKRGKKSLIITSNVKQHGAQVEQGSTNLQHKRNSKCK